MVIKTLKLEGKILFLTYILHSSWRTRDKISWEKNYTVVYFMHKGRSVSMYAQAIILHVCT